ncbi:MAG: TetR/AcrR family transcriptional regulator [Burkholderiales bacterium]|nr:TetR/AcrR family transcriptional regulator [Burkholderiales bacterium]
MPSQSTRRTGAARSANRSGAATRERILDAAERLFSEHGIDGVSMRAIAAEAEATLALANYHFGTKESLYRAVFERRIAPVSAERRAALAAVMRRDRPAPTIREVLDALARPWVEMRGRPGGLAYTRLIAREAGDPAEGRRGIVADLLDPIAREFIAAMRSVLPGTPARRVHWAYHFFIGALLLILTNPDRFVRLSGSVCDIDSDQAVIEEIVTFFCQALAPPGGEAGATSRRQRGRIARTPDSPRKSPRRISG